MWIIAINGEEPITAKGVLDELNIHQNTCEKSNINISLCRRKIYQRTDIEDNISIFDQVRPIFSNLEVIPQKRPPTTNNIGGGLKGLQRKLWKEYLFVKYDKNINIRLISYPIPIKSLPEVTIFLC